MYEEPFPEVDQLVMVNVKQIAEIGAYVHLLEYNNIEGMIQLSEFSRRRIRSIQKLVRRRASPEEVAQCEERFLKSKTVHSIMRYCAEKLDINLEELYTTFGWPLYKEYGHAYDAFKLAITLTPQPVKLRADIECTCFAYEGIEAIRRALLAGEQCSTDEITLIAPPLYVMVTNATDKQYGIQVMEKAIQAIDESIKQSKGDLVVKMKPKAVSETDDAELKQLMEKLAVENTEVAGDDDLSDEE
ncbi:translation initiation factor 2, alpha subunit [Gorgonomyces haynaldii]|nr:translation initiation factor 2, alpha subunit [Gorgonomyces haynaldii]